MCGPTVGWDWLVLDISYVLLLVGGGMVLRAKSTSLVTWVWFGLLSASVGAFLFAATWALGPAMAASADVGTTTGATALLQSC